MAATAVWQEDNGTATGSPLKGATRADANQVDWKSIDNITTPRSQSPIIAGQNSYTKYQFVKFTGTFNQISAGKFAHTSGTLGSGVSLKGKVTSAYTTPSRSALPDAIDMSAPIAINSGRDVNFSTTGPEGSAAPTLTTAGYSQYCVTQIQTTSAAAAGDIGNQVMTFQWNEN
jgi:hypothetical protein